MAGRQDALKQEAARYAVKLIKNNMVIGLGTGTTTRYALLEMADLLKSGKIKNIKGIASSKKTESLAKRLQIPLTDFEESKVIDLTIDGADEVDSQLNLIKGGGGALLREKILIQASKRVVIIVDESKISGKLGEKWAVPVEVLPFCRPLADRFLKDLNASVSLRRKKSGKIFQTDQNNYILDADFGVIDQPQIIAKKLCSKAGIIVHGLFLDLATDVIIGAEKGTTHLKR